MSMLAGPRRKQKVINLRAKNNAWSNDNTKFGQRMLEKMGWSSGKGLGAHENGIVEHVVAKFKNDEKGLGFEDKNDQWTKHEDDFNSLLANLSNGDNNEEKLHSGVSLEVKSKKSKARVHYHKFTRGKDLTRYSEKDLANIFGKKSLKNEEKLEQEILKDDDTTTEQVFTEKGSMEDYFKSKLASLKSKNKISVLNNYKNDEVEADYTFRGFSGTTTEESESQHNCGLNLFSFYNTSNIDIDEENKRIGEYNTSDNKQKRKKRKTKDQDVSEENLNNCLVNNNHCSMNSDSLTLDDVDQGLPKKKKKRSKSKNTELVESVLENDNFENATAMSEQPDKGKKFEKKKYKDQTTQVMEKPSEVAENEEHVEDYVPKKKKKRKNE